jgi:hypothetical protein
MGANAGCVTVVAQYIQRDTRDQIGEEVLGSWAGGSYAWTPRHARLNPPEGAGHVRFIITMQPPSDGGALYLDDCTLLSWGPELASGQAVPTPHNYEWARLETQGGDGDLHYQEERRVYRRAYLAN